MMPRNIFLYIKEKLGPGLLFAAIAVGVSHLVQSTRAGADYGLSLYWLLIVACLVKYPAFRFGSEYAAATGKSLLQAYESQGRWVLLVYALCFPLDMFVATAAIALVTAGIFSNLFQLGIHDIWLSALLLGACAILLISGRYRLFENLTKTIVVLFSIMVIVSAALAVPELDWQKDALTREIVFDQPSILFMIAIAGWLPTGLTVSVFQSLWVCEKAKLSKHTLSIKETTFDFNIGYFGSILLALCFMLLGAAFLFNAGIEVAASPAGFATQLINMFTQVSGAWARPLITIAAFAVMVSTMLAALDACPRVASVLTSTLYPEGGFRPAKQYSFFMLIQVIGATLILLVFLQSFKTFIDFATSVAFLSAPILAFFNHRAMFSKAMPAKLRPGKVLWVWSLSGIVSMAAVAVYYLYIKLF